MCALPTLGVRRKALRVELITGDLALVAASGGSLLCQGEVVTFRNISDVVGFGEASGDERRGKEEDGKSREVELHFESWKER